MTDAVSGIRQAVRRLMRTPTFSIIAALTLAIGIGANTAIFSLVKSVLLSPLPYDSPDELVWIEHTAPGLEIDRVPQSPALHLTLREETRAFQDVAMWRPTGVAVTGLEVPERVTAVELTEGALELLGISPVAGRFFLEGEDLLGADPSVLLSRGFSDRAFGVGTNPVGRSLTVDGISRTILGIVPAGTRLMDIEPEVLIPFSFDIPRLTVSNFSFDAFGRLREGATLDDASADIERAYTAMYDRFSAGLPLEMLQEAGFAPQLRLMKDELIGDVGSLLWILLGSVGIVLLVAVANVANLFMVRTEGRGREVALRTALGASRANVAAPFLWESVVLGMVAALAGLALAQGGLVLLRALGPQDLPRMTEVGLDGGVVLYAVGLALVSSLAFGMIPYFRFGGREVGGSLRDGGRTGSGGRARARAQDLLVVGQVGLALILLVGSGLMVRTFQSLRTTDPGFDDPGQVLTFRIALPPSEVAEEAAGYETFRQIKDRLAALPGVTSVGIASDVPMDESSSGDALQIEDFPSPEGQLPAVEAFKWVAPGYFETMGVPLLAGRDIAETDVQNGGYVAVISESLARQRWGDPAAAIGRRIQPWEDGPWREIVGVSGDTWDDGLDQGPIGMVYWPQMMDRFQGQDVYLRRSIVVVVRFHGALEPLLPSVRQAVWAINPRIPLASVSTLQDYMRASMTRTAFTMAMLGIAAVVALLLGMIGIYGVVSYVVTQRTREIGVRMALGADAGAVRGLVLKRGALLIGSGVLGGLVAAAFLTRLMASVLHGVEALDPITFALGALGLSAVALFATWIPAQRATRVEPQVALRSE